ncbi:MAG: hypothetical protein M1587_07120 [Thaumarchaeota archaeon]|nr:hypothetical protein [Nitrososphaerota archaeon]
MRESTSSSRIYISAFGSGLGHISRIQEIAKTLHPKSTLLYSTFDDALQYLKQEGEAVVEAPSISFKWNEQGGFSGRDTFLRFPLAILSFMRQVGFESSTLAQFKPDLVLSDSRLSTIVAASMNNFPVITILNQFKVLFPPRFRKGRISRFYERIAGDALGLLWSLSDQVLVPDLPPPFTICESNVSGTEISHRARFIGFMSPREEIARDRLERVSKALNLDSRPLVYMQISGPAQSKTHFSRTAIEAVSEIAADYNVVVSLGIPKGSSEARRIANGGWVYEWCPIKNELFELSSLLVARAGHTTIGQCVDSGKPAVLVPIYNHSEQIWNADKFSRMGLGLNIRSEELTRQRLVECVKQCMTDPTYKANAARIQEVSRRHDGLGNASRIINYYVERSVEKQR